MNRLTPLRLRLFAWLCAASVVSGATSFVVLRLSAPDHSDLPNRALVRKLVRRLAREDDAARKATLAEASENAGIPFGFVPPEQLPKGVDFRMPPALGRYSLRRALPTKPERVGAILLPGDGWGYVPVLRPRGDRPPEDDNSLRAEDPFETSVLVGAVRFPEGEPLPFGPLPAAAVFGGVLLAFAQLLSRRLAAPLERIGAAAARFGRGDLSARVALPAAEAGASETAALAASFDAMAERISREVREGRELLGAVSHELRSPLGRAKVAVATAREKLPEASPATSPLASAERELARVDGILGDLLASARMGLSDLRREETPLVAWLRGRIADEEMPPMIALEAPDDDAPFALDRPLVARAVHNLLENARRHGGSDAEIDVTVTFTRGPKGAVTAASLTVADRGPGFPAALLPKLFTPFVRGDDARNPTQGSGLGLALVRRIAEAHGGTARAANREGGGAAVTIELLREAPGGEFSPEIPARG